MISSAEKDSPVGYDCFFEIMEANRSYFERLEKNSSSADKENEDEDEVKKAFSTKQMIPCVIVNNR